MRKWRAAAGVFLKVSLAFGCLFVGADVHAQNAIQLENAKPGSADWQLTNPATNHEIEGYASLTSVNRGGQISFFVNTTDPTFTLDVFRMGWYGGAGARRMMTPAQWTGTQQPIPIPDPSTGIVECRWTNPYVLTIPYTSSDPTSWASGVYLVRLTGSTSGKQSFIIFIVRDDARSSTYLAQLSTNTFQAYNNWGGKSLYGFNSTNGLAAINVSFNRPYALGNQANSASGVGAGEFLTNFQPATSTPPAGWGYNMVRFLEREGYDVAYIGDVDAHESQALLLSHKTLLIVGHSEYWSWQMRFNVQAARDAGVGIGFFSSNTCYWQIRFGPSAVTAAVDRTIIAYKELATSDPYFSTPSVNNLTTTQWRLSPVNLPEEALVGTMFGSLQANSSVIVSNPSSWVYTFTGLLSGSALPGILGYEVDYMHGGQPAGTVAVAHEPTGDTTVYTAASGATVFATGTFGWSWGLDDYNAPNIRPSVINPAAQQITRNVLARLAGQPFSPAFSITPSPRFQTVSANSGTMATYAIPITSFGYSPTISLSVTGLPSSVAYSLTPSTVIGSGSSVLTVSPSSSSPLGTYVLTISASDGTQTRTEAVTLTIEGQGVAAFIGFDSATQGNWQGKYGVDGYSIANASQTLPAYTTFAVQNQLNYTWTSSTSDPRALQLPSGGGRIASCWYNNPKFNFDVNISDTKAHQIALYVLDWDGSGARGETIQIVDANTNSVLSTQAISNFSGGTYLVWSVSGHVKINVAWTAGSNAVISGMFLSTPSQVAPAITSASSAAFTTGSPGTFSVTAVGSPAPALSETGALPGGVTFNAATGVLSGTPASGSNGSYPLTFMAGNGVSPNAGQSFMLTVNQAGQAPAITSSSSTALTVGMAGTFTVMATGSPNPTLSETGALPSGVTFNASTGVLSGTPAAGSNGIYPLVLSASNGVSPNATQNLTLTVNQASASGSGVTFVGFDTTTQGGWQGKYGTDGYSIANYAQSLPNYATFTPQNGLLWTWSSSTSDVRALRLPNSSVGVASTWYNSPGFNYDVNITDGNAHQVALYALDWDSPGGVRSETIQIVDANNPSHVLDTETLLSYTGGTYLIWNISGHVTINVTRTGGANAAVSGVFFGRNAPATATFLRSDTASQGNWQGKYGADGYSIANALQALPAYAIFAPQNQLNYTWASGTSDPRALQLGGGGGRIASCWYNNPNFDFDVNLTDGKVHQITLYMLDWDGNGARAETIQIVDANTSGVLSTQAVSSFSGGTYLVWNISGHVKINITSTGWANAVVSGIFFN